MKNIIKHCKNSVLLLAVFLALGLTKLGANAAWVDVYDQDFSSDPAWTTDDPAQLGWDSTTQTFRGRQVNQYGTYAYINLPSLDPNLSWQLDCDLLIEGVEWSAGLSFGLFDQTLASQMTGAFSDLSLVDAGYSSALYSYHGATSHYGHWAPNGTWRHSRLTFDADSKVLTWVMSDAQTGVQLAQETCNVTAPFPEDMTRLGVSRVFVKGATSGVNPSAAVAYSIDNLLLRQGSSDSTPPPFQCPVSSPEFGVVTDQTSVRTYGLDFDGRFLVWRDERGGEQHIYAYDFGRQACLRVSDTAAHQANCRVSDGVVAWMNGAQNEIYLKDLIGRLPTTPVNPVVSAPWICSTDIGGDWLAWSQSATVGGMCDLYVKNLRTGEQMQIPGPGNKGTTKIFGDVVIYNSAPCGDVWACDWDVYGYNLITRVNFPIKVGPEAIGFVDLSGDLLLLNEKAYSGHGKVYVLNLKTQEERMIASDAQGLAISGHTVVYRAWPSQWGVVYDLCTGNTCELTTTRMWPAVMNEEFVFWVDRRPPASDYAQFLYGRRMSPTAGLRLICPPSIFTGTDPGQCSTVVNYPPPTVSDNCFGATVECSPSSGSAFPRGATTVTCIATDASGSIATCSFTVTVNDTECPTVSCPPDIAVGCSTEELVSVAFSEAATDNCDPSPRIVCMPLSGSGFPVGTSVVECTATDADGNSSSCSFNVTRAPLSFAGFLAPIGGADSTGGSFDAPLRTFKVGSTVPVKFTASCVGVPLVIGTHRLQVIKCADETTAGEPIDATPQDTATSGDQFRLADGQWHFNLDTRATGMSPGKWLVLAVLSDGSQHSAFIQLK